MHGLIRNTIPVILSVSLGLLASSALAENKCKGMSQSVCTADASCSWVKSYVRSDKRKVDAYCRVKSGKKKEAVTASDVTQS